MLINLNANRAIEPDTNCLEKFKVYKYMALININTYTG